MAADPRHPEYRCPHFRIRRNLIEGQKREIRIREREEEVLNRVSMSDECTNTSAMTGGVLADGLSI